MEDIDKSLPPEPEMRSYKVMVGSEEDAEEVEIRAKNLLEVIIRLVSDPRYKDNTTFTPVRLFADKSRKVRIYRGICSANWMWRMQVSLQ
jgi:hypothetical protein